MNALKYLIALLICVCLGWSNRAPVAAATAPAKPLAARYVIGLSPFLDRSVKDDLFRQVVGFILKGMPLGSSLELYDAYYLQTIAILEIPDVAAFKSEKTRANQLKSQVNQLKTFLAAERPQPTATGRPLAQALRLPQFMDFVHANVARSNQPITVALIGSPLYLDEKEPAFSMVEGYFPSDGHLLAGRDQSVFGVKDLAGSLEGVTVHLGYFGDPWVSEVHQEKINRFWTLFLSQQGARLVTFCGDLPTVFRALQAEGDLSTAATTRHQLDSSKSKIEMIRITRDLGVTDWITQETLPNISQRPPRSLVGPMKIGIRWRGRIDLDLYATPKPDAETLFFEHMRSPEGYYFKDHRTSPEREYEFIEFEDPVDVRTVDARINFFEGQAPGGPGGEVRIEFEGKIYAGRFSLSAQRGNQGRTGSGQSSHWTRIDVPSLLHVLESIRDSAALRAP